MKKKNKSILFCTMACILLSSCAGTKPQQYSSHPPVAARDRGDYNHPAVTKSTYKYLKQRQ